MRVALPPVTLFWRFFFSLLVAALLPLGVTWWIARELTTENAEQLAEARLYSEAVNIARDASGWLRLNYETLSEHADTVAMRSMLPDLQRPVLVAIANHQPWTDVAFTVGRDGMSLSRSDSKAPIDYHDRMYFKDALEGQPMGQQALVSRTTGRPGWVIAVPIKDAVGTVVGVLAKTNGLSQLTDELANVRFGKSSRAILLSPDGHLAGKTGYIFQNEKDLRDWSKHPLYLNRESTTSGVLRYVDDGVPTIAVLQPARFGWFVAVQMDEAEALQPVAEMNRTMQLLFLVALLLAAAFAGIFAPGLSRPLVRLTTIAEDMSRGQFSHEINGTERRDEIGALCRAIERMTRSLKLAMERLAQGGSQ
jgi:methyl-accepting chemotaxis protein